VERTRFFTLKSLLWKLMGFPATMFGQPNKGVPVRKEPTGTAGCPTFAVSRDGPGRVEQGGANREKRETGRHEIGKTGRRLGGQMGFPLGYHTSQRRSASLQEPPPHLCPKRGSKQCCRMRLSLHRAEWDGVRVSV